MTEDDRPVTSTMAASPNRVDSLDVYRGFVMLLLLGEALHLGKMAESFPESGLWRFLGWHQSHVAWRGCSLHDLIQPSFSFLVGAALPFSLAARSLRGQSKVEMTLHALWRAVVLVCLGVFLRSTGRPMTNFTFEDTLTQIGLGYPFLFLLGLRPKREAVIALVVILMGIWAASNFYPVPEPWAKNANIGHDFDVWFLNLFPREAPFIENTGGYLTLAFFHQVVDRVGIKAWVWPLTVIGTNSIAAYLIEHLCKGFISRSLTTHLGGDAFAGFGEAYEPLLQGAVVLLVMWGILAWMWRRRIFLRV